MKVMSLIKNLFKFSCILTTCFMVGYWIYKFHKNEDITVIEYNSPDGVVNVIYPELTICLKNPFLTEKLKEIHTFLDQETYLKYLKGRDIFNETYKDIDYDYITVNLYDYFEVLYIVWKNRTESICLDKNDCPFLIFKNNFNGFLNYAFLKCFAVEINTKHWNTPLELFLSFNATLRTLLNGITFSGFNYPQQFTRSWSFTDGQYIWRTPEEHNAVETFEILSIETVVRRNKRNEPCFLDWMNYDNLLLQKHLKDVGCRAPYHKTTHNFPICNTFEQMKKSYIDIGLLPRDYLLVPCQDILEVPYRYSKSPFAKEKGFSIDVNYPSNNVKTVRQSQAVDVHTLIGNIGGYIGLFMGNLCLV